MVPAKTGKDEALATARYEFHLGVVQVLNERTKTMHLSPGEGTACNSRKCGLAAVPAKAAEFAHGTMRWSPELTPQCFCLSCHGSRGIKREGATLRVAGEDVPSSESPASETDSDSSSGS